MLFFYDRRRRLSPRSVMFLHATDTVFDVSMVVKLVLDCRDIARMPILGMTGVLLPSSLLLFSLCTVVEICCCSDAAHCADSV